MAAFSEEIVEIKCDPHKILNNTYLYRFFCSKFKSFHNRRVHLIRRNVKVQALGFSKSSLTRFEIVSQLVFKNSPTRFEN